MSSTPLLISILDYAGVGLFAVGSALASRRCGCDVVATVLLACMAAMGGGTLRDLLIQQPVFWIADPGYIIAGVAAATVVWRFGCNRRLQPLLPYVEAVGISVYAVVGAMKAEFVGVGYIASIVLGSLTASFGGITSESLAGRQSPLARRDVYITPALCSAVSYVLIVATGTPLPVAAATGALSGIALRLLVMHHRLHLTVP